VSRRLDLRGLADLGIAQPRLVTSGTRVLA
jgi:hypothetical protein